MTIRDLMPFGRTSVPVMRSVSPIGDFQQEVNRLFEDFFGNASLPSLFARGAPEARRMFDFAPAIDVKETEKSYRIVADVPGIDSKDVQVTIADGYVTIKGEKKTESKEEKEGYHRQERSYGSFQRVIALPDTVNFDKAEASVKDGVLSIEVPKKTGSQAKERTLEIRSAA